MFCIKSSVAKKKQLNSANYNFRKNASGDHLKIPSLFRAHLREEIGFPFLAIFSGKVQSFAPKFRTNSLASKFHAQSFAPNFSLNQVRFKVRPKNVAQSCWHRLAYLKRCRFNVTNWCFGPVASLDNGIDVPRIQKKKKLEGHDPQ